MKHRLIGATVLALAVAGCGSLPGPEPARESLPPASRHVGDLLAYFRQLLQLPAEEQRRQYEAVRSSYEASQNDEDRMKLVLALLVPEAPWRDDALAVRLLAADASLQQGIQNPYGDLALLLERMVADRLRVLREENRKLESMQQRMAALREEHKKIEMLKQKLETMNEECRKAETLQKKLEGLREIDRDFRKRANVRSAP